MPIKGKQIATGVYGIATANLMDGVLSADASGRAKMANGFFDLATVNSKFAAASIALDRLAEAVIQADGGQAFTADQSMGGFKLTGLATPTSGTDGANKDYVDAASQGLDVKASVRVAAQGILDDSSDITGSPTYTPTGGTSTRGQITATLTVSATLTLDGVAIVSGNRILLKDEGSLGGLGGAANGIWVATIAGTALTLDRATDFDADAEVTAGAFTFIEEGTANADSGWVLITNDPIVLGGASGTQLTWVQFSGAGQITAGNGMTKSGNTLDVAAANTSIVVNPDSIQVGYGLAAGLATVNAGDTADAGSSDLAARIDHQHPVSTAAPGTIQCDDSAAEGSATSLARSDHRHAIVTDVPVSVGTANAEGSGTSFSRSNHVHAAPVPTSGDKDMIPSATIGDDASTFLTISAPPALDGYIYVGVNGAMYLVGDGSKIKDCFFSSDGGTTAKSIADITTGDTLYWNLTYTGFNLATSDRVSFFYEVLA